MRRWLAGAAGLLFASGAAQALNCGGFSGCPDEPWVHCQRWRTPLERQPDGRRGENGKPQQICKRPVDWDKPFAAFPVYFVPPNIADTNLRLQYGLPTEANMNPGPPPFFILGFDWGRLTRPEGVFRFVPEARIRVSRERQEVFSWRMRYAVPEKQLVRTEQRSPGSVYFVETLELPDYAEIYGNRQMRDEAADGRPTRDGRPDPGDYRHGTPLEGKLFPDGTYRHRNVYRLVFTKGPAGYAVSDWQVKPTDPAGTYRVKVWAYGKLVAERDIEVY